MSASPELRTLVIGDVHGHVDRLAALLEQEGIIDGEGNRVDRACRVIQLGDLGHFGTTGDATGDHACWRSVGEWIDLVLWGNHDRAAVDRRHAFAGYARPLAPLPSVLNHHEREGRVRFAAASHGHLLTHAGVHAAHAVWLDVDNAENAAGQLNQVAWHRVFGDVVNAIGRSRGGRNDAGGILWRDFDEPLADHWPQVFGHTRGDDVRRVGDSWCIDVGSRDNGRLAGLWLPDLRIVEVDVRADVVAA